ncbi:MAG: lytic transglycosylase domain-containing protein [Acidobacteria bacterium]|nr:lytic transglycosylase domain-containing protein [Acidobacteriota bacterium]
MRLSVNSNKSVLSLIGSVVGLALLAVSGCAQSAVSDERRTETVATAMIVVLKDGSSFEVDQVQEVAGNLVYRMGSMQGFLNRAEVAEVRPGTTKSPQIEVMDNPGFTTGHRGLDQLIIEAGSRNQVDPLLIFLVMREESGFNQRAVSRVGARGLMQLMPATARRLGVRNTSNPRENVEAGTLYLRTLLNIFGGDVNLALAAYNAGESAVRRYGGRIPPYVETRRYVWRINTAYRAVRAQ